MNYWGVPFWSKFQPSVGKGIKSGYCSESQALCNSDMRRSPLFLSRSTISRWPAGSLGISAATSLKSGLLYLRGCVPAGLADFLMIIEKS